MRRLEGRRVLRGYPQLVGKAVSALSLISHLSLLGRDALPDQCKHLLLETQMQETLTAQTPQEPGCSTLSKKTEGNGGEGSPGEGTLNSEGNGIVKEISATRTW